MLPPPSQPWRDCVGAGPSGPFPATASAEGAQFNMPLSHGRSQPHGPQSDDGADGAHYAQGTGLGRVAIGTCAPWLSPVTGSLPGFATGSQGCATLRSKDCAREEGWVHL
jgi:hypothetical protein